MAVEITENCKCEKIVKVQCGWTGAISHTRVCGKKAKYILNGRLKFCAHHAKKGRFVIRNGDVGEILDRFDTEEELRLNIHLYPGMRMQKITKSHRKNLY